MQGCIYFTKSYFAGVEKGVLVKSAFYFLQTCKNNQG